MLNDFEKAVVNVVERMGAVRVVCPHCDKTRPHAVGYRSFFYVRQGDVPKVVFCPFCGQMAKGVT